MKVNRTMYEQDEIKQEIIVLYILIC